MYCTALSKELRYISTCIINGKIIKTIDTLVDTGAMFTCYKAHYLGLKPEDVDMKKSITLTGFVGDYSAVFYRYDVRQFTVGNIDMGSQTIWVTFDPNITDSILGTDILQQTTFLHRKNNDLIFFSDENELRNYIIK